MTHPACLGVTRVAFSGGGGDEEAHLEGWRAKACMLPEEPAAYVPERADVRAEPRLELLALWVGDGGDAAGDAKPEKCPPGGNEQAPPPVGKYPAARP